MWLESPRYPFLILLSPPSTSTSKHLSQLFLLTSYTPHNSYFIINYISSKGFFYLQSEKSCLQSATITKPPRSGISSPISSLQVSTIPSLETRAVPPNPAQRGLLGAILRPKILKRSHPAQMKSPRKKTYLQIRRTTPRRLTSLSGLLLHPMDTIHTMDIHPAGALHTMVPPLRSVQEAFPSMDVVEAITRAVAPTNSVDGAAEAVADTVVAVIGPPPPLAAGAAGTLI